MEKIKIQLKKNIILIVLIIFIINILTINLYATITSNIKIIKLPLEDTKKDLKNESNDAIKKKDIKEKQKSKPATNNYNAQTYIKVLKTLKKDSKNANAIEKKKEIEEQLYKSEPNKRFKFLSELCTKNQKECQEFLNAYNKKDCSKAFFSSLCEIFVSKDEEDIMLNDFKKELNKIENEKNNEKEPANTNKEYLTLLKKKANTLGLGKELKDKNDIDGFIAQIHKNLSKCSNPETCKKLKILYKLAQEANKHKKVKSNIVFAILNAIKNPDTSGMKTASFLFEKKFNNVPEFLRESIPSQICLHKIRGYLDKDIKSNFGITRYECDTEKKNSPEIKRCVNVIGDLRAQRTTITPDHKIGITYSYYLKNPIKPFKLELIYKGDGIIKKYQLENEPRNKNYNSVTIPLEYEDKIDNNYFIIRLQSGTFRIEYPAILISPKTTITGKIIGNEEGEKEAEDILQRITEN